MAKPKVKAATPALKKVVLSVRLAGAKEVIATGDFSGWAHDSIRLQRDGENTWKATLTLAPGEYQYRLLVDGEWREDPGATRRVPNPYGTENCVLVV